MPYTNSPATVPRDAVRLMVGDTYSDIELLVDAEYNYYLTKNSNNISRTAIDAAWAITFKLARWTRERTGDIEVYGSEWARNYRSALLEFIRNPSSSINQAMPYAGGISKEVMKANDLDSDNVRPVPYLGMGDEVHVYDQDAEQTGFF